MSGHTIKAFRHNGKEYDHVIFSREDDRVELQDMNGKCLLTFTANCYVKKPDGTIYGTLHMWDGYWFLSQSPKGYGNRTEFPQHGNDLLSAEVEISKMFLDEMGE